MFAAASVTQQRNVHDLTRDFSQEVIGYERTCALIDAAARDPRDIFGFLPGQSVAAFLEYNDLARHMIG